MAAVLGMTRLFAGTRWVAPLLISAVAAHALATPCLRRQGVPLALAGGLMAVGAGLVITWTSLLVHDARRHPHGRHRHGDRART